MQRILMPSCLSVKARASKRLSSPTNLWTYLERMVREAMKEANEPITVAVETMNHPLGNPYTNPAIVTVVLYPMIGGKAQINVRSQRTIHPPVTSLQSAANGARNPNIRSL